MVNPSFSDLVGRPVHLRAFGFGSGLFPRAPGTAGTLVAVPLAGLVAAGLLVAVQRLVV